MSTLTRTIRCFVALAGLSAMTAGCVASVDESDDPSDVGEAEQDVVSGGTLTVAKEKPLSYLLGAAPDGEAGFEASGVQLVGGYLYVIFDNIARVAKIPTSLGQNSGVYTPGTLSDPDKQYEGITFDNNNTTHFYLVSETSATGTVVQLDGSGSAQGEEYQTTDYTFPDANLGFEGVAYVRRNNNDYLLGLCEGASCGTDTSGSYPGRIKVLRQSGSSWVTESEIVLPLSSFSFQDYSDIALMPSGAGYKMAITSQMSKKVWIGTLSGTSWTIPDLGVVYDLPSAAYCRIEGVTFLGATQLAMVSDWNQHDSVSCLSKDQSVHIFNIP